MKMFIELQDNEDGLIAFNINNIGIISLLSDTVYIDTISGETYEFKGGKAMYKYIIDKIYMANNRG